MSWRSRLCACHPCLFSLGLLLAACSGNAFLIGESNTDGSDIDGARVARPEPEDHCPDLAELRLLDNTCWPTRHVGRWHGFATTSPQYHHRRALPFEYPSGDLLLELDEQGRATLTFSASPEQPRARLDDAGLDLDAGPSSVAADASTGIDGGMAGDAGAVGRVDAGAQHPEDAGARLDAGVAGSRPALGLALDFPYRLRELKMSGAALGRRPTDPRVDFSLLIAEPWGDVCAASLAQLDPELAPCVCAADVCSPDPGLLTVTLSLSADGRALRGSARSEAPEGVLAAGWEFVRE